MFRPDNGHVHHRLVGMGLTTKKAVLIIYSLTFFLCIMAVVLVNIRDEQAGLLLIVLAAGAVVFVRKMGYLEYIASDKLYGWFRDLTDEAGISHERRSFLSIQIDTGRSQNLEELWRNLGKALKMLEFDRATVGLNFENPSKREEENHWVWTREGFVDSNSRMEERLLKLDLPLLDDENKNYGLMRLVKDLERDPISHYTLRRVEHLRRTVIATLKKISADYTDRDDRNQ